MNAPLFSLSPLSSPNPIQSNPQETKAVFEKLHKYIGKNIRRLVEAPSSNDGEGGAASTSNNNNEESAFVFRLHRNRVYYVRASLMRRATSVSRDKLVHLGTAVGRLTHSGKFRLTVGALDLLSQHAKYKASQVDLSSLSLSFFLVLVLFHAGARAQRFVERQVTAKATGERLSSHGSCVILQFFSFLIIKLVNSWTLNSNP